jgi:hypothetical protein
MKLKLYSIIGVSYEKNERGKKMKKILSLVLVLLMLASMLLACQKNEDPNSTENGPAVVPQGEVNLENVDDRGIPEDRLPRGAELEALGFAGSTVKILGYEEEIHQTIPDADSTEDPLKSKLFHHWNSIKERFDIQLEVKYVKGRYQHKAAFLTEARADDAAYDLIQTESLFPIELATEGRLCNLKKLGFPDLAMPWWPESVELFTQYDALYMIGSNSSACGISNFTVIFINDGVITSKGMASPVESVIRGVWTVEEMTNIVKLFAGAAENASEDTRYYGLVVDHTSRPTALYYSSGFDTVVNNVDGVGELAYNDESELEAISKALNKYEEMFTGVQTKIHRVSDRDVFDELSQSRTAMLLGSMEIIRSLENTEEYTVVPLPLLDESQSNPESAGKGYRTVHRDCFDMWCMPTTTANKTLGGMILEANASGEYRNIGIFYYDQYLKDRYSNGASGRECFDILRASVIYDLGRVAGQGSGFGAQGDFATCLTNATGFSNTFSANIKGKLDAHVMNFNKMLENMAKYVNN